MALLKDDKSKIIDNFKKNPKDTGNTEIQIAILTSEINYLTNHLKENKKDIQARRSLLFKVSKRKRLLKYLDRKDHDSFKKIKQNLKIRG